MTSYKLASHTSTPCFSEVWVRCGSVEEKPQNTLPHHLHIYMQGVVGWWFRLKCGVEQGVVNRRVNR